MADFIFNSKPPDFKIDLNASASVIQLDTADYDPKFSVVEPLDAPVFLPKDASQEVQWPFVIGAAFDDLNASAADATASFAEFRDAAGRLSQVELEPKLPHVSQWLALAQIGRTIMTVRLDTGRLMTTRPRWVYVVPTSQGELVGEFFVTRPGCVVGVVISDDRGKLLFASDDISATLVPGEDLTIALPIGIT